MRTINHWIYYGLAIGVVMTLAWRWWPNDLRKVERHMSDLLELVSKSSGESLPVAAARSLEVGSYLNTNVMLKLGYPFPGTMRRSDAMSLLQQGRMQAERISVKNRGHEVSRQADDSIRYDVTIEAGITYRGQKEDIIGSYRFIWNKIEDRWKITGADILEVIEHPMAQPFE